MKPGNSYLIFCVKIGLTPPGSSFRTGLGKAQRPAGWPGHPSARGTVSTAALPRRVPGKASCAALALKQKEGFCRKQSWAFARFQNV